jgi:tetratricopeptide (TPR) repeat protein
MPDRFVSPQDLNNQLYRMDLLTSNARARFFAAVLTVAALLSLAVAREPQAKVPERTGYVNDFAGSIDSAAKERLENILANLKQRADIEFVVATVNTMGTEDIYRYSSRVALAWDVGVRTSPRKGLLLVIATDRFFVQASQTARDDLPEGLIGEMTNRLRLHLEKGDLSGGLFEGVKSFVGLLGERKDFKFEELDQLSAENVAAAGTRPRTVETARAPETPSPQPNETPIVSETPMPVPAATVSPIDTKVSKPATTPPAPETPAASPVAAPSESPSETPAPSPVETQSQPAATVSPNPEVAKTPQPSETASPTPQATATSQPSETPAPSAVPPAESATPQPTQTIPTEPVERVAAIRTSTKEFPRKTSATAKKSPEASEVADPEDEKEEVELTLTLPVDERLDVLRAFIAAHPKSVAIPRANELIVVTHATLGDQQLQAGDVDGGLEQFRLAIAEAPPDMTDRLFTEVIARIPMNLFLRDQRAAAIEFAHQVEALARLNPKKLLALEEFYLNTENVPEANRIAELAVAQGPDLAATHQALGAARHISLRLDEAEKEYARALELDPKSTTARRSLADLKRSAGKSEEALVLYRELLQNNPKDKPALAGMVISLFESGKTQEAQQQIDAALKDPDQSQNLALLVGAAYWLVAHNEAPRSLELAETAVQIEPRFSWAQIARARALVANKNPLEAERAIRFARQFGAFPTLDYELASVLASLGLYDEAAQELARSFSVKDGQIETKLAGRNTARAQGFIELLGLERRAAIFQPSPADTEANSRMLKGLLTFAMAINLPEGQPVKENEVLAAAREFIMGNDAMRAYRQVYVASKLIKRGVVLENALEITDAARSGVEAALDVPAATVAVQAEELSDIRARALSQGGTPDIPDAPRTALSALLRGRIEDLTGLALFNQDKSTEALTHLRRAVSVLPQGTPLWRASLWHLGSALEASGHNDQALLYYIKSYMATGPDPVRRAVIENVYKKMNGTLDGLDEKIGPGFNSATPTPSPGPTTMPSPGSPPPTDSPVATPTPTPVPALDECWSLRNIQADDF